LIYPLDSQNDGSQRSSGQNMTEQNSAPVAVSIIVPAYNEENAIQGVLNKLLSIEDSAIEAEIVVIDDGSQDRTSDVIPQHRKITLLSHETNRGYGAAIKIGIRHASHDLICIIDADGTYPSEPISEMVTSLIVEHYDMVVGARIGENVTTPLIRRPVKWIMNQLARIVTNSDIPDLNSGLRIFRRTVALCFFNLLPDGFSFTTTITLAMLTNGYRVGYIPIDYFPRIGRSKIRPIRDTLKFLSLILQIALYFAPLKVFLPLGGILIMLAIGWGMFSMLVLGKLADVSTLVILMAGIQIGMLGLLAELINRRLPDYSEANPSEDRQSTRP
jgi:glycosyltransferase involved in cell wall biosynthesis